MESDLRNGFALGDIKVYPLRNEITGATETVHILPKAMDVLCCLAANAGNVVERDRIIDDVWGRVVIADDVLTRCVSEIRSALGESATSSHIIQTVPKRGYSLNSDVRPLSIDANETESTTSLWTQISERSVIRVGLAYLAIAWLIISVVETTIPYLDLPTSIIRVTIIAAIAGLPIALTLAWVYEITPHGIIRDGTQRSRSRSSRRLRRLDVFTLAAVVTGVAFFLFQQTGTVRKQPGSIAVLPFEMLDNSTEYSYFGDGLAEDLIHLLSKSRELRVSPRAASFYYPDLDPVSISNLLQVAAILSGSVRIDGDTIIVYAELVDMVDGRAQPLFEGSPLRIQKQIGDIFVLQNEIAQLVIRSLPIDRDGRKAADLPYRQQTGNINAYKFYSRAREILRSPPDADSLAEATSLLNRAIEYDPDYAEAYALLCEVGLARYELSYFSAPGMLQIAEQSCLEARSIDPQSASVNLALGNLYRIGGQYAKSEREFDAAIEKDPTLVDAHIGLGETLGENFMISGDSYEERRAENALRNAVELDPGYFASYATLGNFYMDIGRYADARDQYATWSELTPTSVAAHNNLATAHYMMEDFDRAVESWQMAREEGGNRSTFTNLGLHYYYLGEYETAVEMQRQAIDYAEKDHRIWGRLAESARFVPGLEAESAAAYEKAAEFANIRLQDNSRDWETLALLAIYESHLGKTERALTTLGKGLAIGNDQPDMHFFAALVYHELGNYDEVYDEVRTSLSLGFPPRLVRYDPDLAPLFEQERFSELLSN